MKSKLIKWFLRIAILIWPIYWLAQIFIGDLGASPALTLSRELGFIAITLLTINIILGILLDVLRPAPSWVRFWVSERRWWGVISFLVLFVHVAFYFVNEGFEAQAWTQIVTKTYLIFASISFILLFLLAITSNNFSVRKLGPKRWKMIHSLIYLVQILIMGHVLLIEKANLRLYTPWLALLALAQAIRWIIHFRRRATQS